jgi:hypothetical protein
MRPDEVKSKDINTVADRPSEVNSEDIEAVVNDLKEPIPKSTPRVANDLISDDSITPRHTQSPRPLLLSNDELTKLHSQHAKKKHPRPRFHELHSQSQNTNQFLCFAPLLILGIVTTAMGAFFLNKDILEHMFGDDTGEYGKTVTSVGSSFIGASPGLIFIALVLVFYLRKVCPKQEDATLKASDFENIENFDDSSSDTDHHPTQAVEESMATEDNETIYDVEDTYVSYQNAM